MRNADKPGSPEFLFATDVLVVTEDKLKLNLPKESHVWQDALYKEYVAAGSPKPTKKWLMERLKGEFKSMDKPPKWVDFETSKWPFHKDKPMVFVAQIPLKTTKDTDGLLENEGVSYFFGLLDKGEHGEDLMVYKTQTLGRW